MTVDIGFTHVALPCSDAERTIAFYKRYANMDVVHRRNCDHGEVVWLCDHTRAFVIVFLEGIPVKHPLAPVSHLGVGCKSRAEVDRILQQAKSDGIQTQGPYDSGPPVGYWIFLTDPDGHKLELSYGQEIGLTVEDAPS